MSCKNIILVDAHIHIHSCFDLNLLLDSAYKNFCEVAKLFNVEKFDGVLCLTENFDVNYFSEFKNIVENKDQLDSKTWQFHLTNEPNSIKLWRNPEEIMYIIAGRQIVTKEKLEVLAIGLTENIKNGKSIEQVIQLVKEKNALPIIPWGAGKWTGSRKKVIDELVDRYTGDFLFLGDNGNRPFFWSKPSIFKEAEKLNIRNLQGTDPFPFESEITKAGSYGFGVEGEINSFKSV